MDRSGHKSSRDYPPFDPSLPPGDTEGFPLHCLPSRDGICGTQQHNTGPPLALIAELNQRRLAFHLHSSSHLTLLAFSIYSRPGLCFELKNPNAAVTFICTRPGITKHNGKSSFRLVSGNLTIGHCKMFKGYIFSRHPESLTKILSSYLPFVFTALRVPDSVTSAQCGAKFCLLVTRKTGMTWKRPAHSSLWTSRWRLSGERRSKAGMAHGGRMGKPESARERKRENHNKGTSAQSP